MQVRVWTFGVWGEGTSENVGEAGVGEAGTKAAT